MKNRLKKFIAMMLAIVLLTSTFPMAEDVNADVSVTSDDYIKLTDPDDGVLEVTADKYMYYIAFDASYGWKASKDASWLSISPTSSQSNSGGKATLQVDVRANTGAEREATITIKLKNGNAAKTITVVQAGKPIDDYDRVSADANAIEIDYASGDSKNSVTDDLGLPTKGSVYGSSISWESSDTSIITNKGVVTRPKKDTEVTLTADVLYATGKTTKTFTVVVKSDKQKDEIKPTISKLSCSAGKTFEYGTEATFTAQAYDNVAMYRLTLYVDGSRKTRATTSDFDPDEVWELTYETSKLGIGAHEISVLAEDEAGNEEEKSMTVTVVEATAEAQQLADPELTISPKKLEVEVGEKLTVTWKKVANADYYTAIIWDMDKPITGGGHEEIYREDVKSGTSFTSPAMTYAGDNFCVCVYARSYTPELYPQSAGQNSKYFSVVESAAEAPSIDMEIAKLDKSSYNPGDTIKITGIKVKNAVNVHFSGSLEAVGTKDVKVTAGDSWTDVGTVALIIPEWEQTYDSYYISVYAENADGEKTSIEKLNYNLVEATEAQQLADPELTISPKNLEVEVGEKLTVTWEKVANADYYTAIIWDINKLITGGHEEVYREKVESGTSFTSPAMTYGGRFCVCVYARSNTPELYLQSAGQNSKYFTVVVSGSCDHSGLNYDYVLDTTEYVDTGDGANHYRINSYRCICKDCGGFVGTVVDEYSEAATEPHSYDANGVCVCSAATATLTGPVQLATPAVTLTGLDFLYKGDVTGVVWDKVPNATLYALYVWNDGNVVDYAEYTADAKLEYSHTFDQEGAYIIGVYACAPGSTDYLQSEAGSVNIVVAKKPTAKPAEIIGNKVELKCEGDAPKAGEQFSLTVVTNADTTRLVAVNNGGTGFQYPDAWTKTQNGDGTYTWTRSYKADVEKEGRYWTVTPYNADGIAGTAVKSNKIDIAPAVEDEWYTAYYKFNDGDTKSPAANGVITVDRSVNKNIIIYAGDHHPSDYEGNNPYYYKFSNTAVLSAETNKSYKIEVVGTGSCTVEIWNEDTNSKVASVVVRVVANAETLVDNANAVGRKFSVNVLGSCGTQFLQNGGTIDFISYSPTTAIMFVLSEYINGEWQTVDTSSEKGNSGSLTWNISKEKGVVEEYEIEDGIFTATSFDDQRYVVTLKYYDGTFGFEQAYTMNITVDETVKKAHYSLVSETGNDYEIVSSAWGKSDSELPSIYIKDNYTGEVLQVKDGNFILSIVESESTGKVWSNKLDIGKIEHRTKGTVYIDLFADGVQQNTRFKVFCTNDDYISLDARRAYDAQKIKFNLSPSNDDIYGVCLTIEDIPDFAKNGDLYTIGYTIACGVAGNDKPESYFTRDVGSWSDVEKKMRVIEFHKIEYNEYVSVMVYIRSKVDGSHMYSAECKQESSYANRYYQYLLKERDKPNLSKAIGWSDKWTDEEIRCIVENMSDSTLRKFQINEYAGFLAEYVVQTAEDLADIMKSDKDSFWKAVGLGGLVVDYYDTIWKEGLATAVGITFQIDGREVELAINEAAFWYGLAKNPKVLKVAMHYFNDGINALKGEKSVLFGGTGTGVDVFDSLGLEDYEMWLDPAQDIIYLIDSSKYQDVIKFSVDVSAGLQYLQDSKAYTEAGVPSEVAKAIAQYNAEGVKEEYNSLIRIDRDITGYVTGDYFLKFSDSIKKAICDEDSVFVISTSSGNITDNNTSEVSYDEWVERMEWYMEN